MVCPNICLNALYYITGAERRCDISVQSNINSRSAAIISCFQCSDKTFFFSFSIAKRIVSGNEVHSLLPSGLVSHNAAVVVEIPDRGQIENAFLGVDI